MNRRTALRTLLPGIVFGSGCLTGRSTDSETTSTETGRTTESTSTERGTTEERTTTDRCPPSAVSEDRTHARSDYGLGIVSEATDDPAAAAVVGEDWRSTLEVDAMSDADEEFVRATDFEESSVLVVQYGKSSSGYALRVTSLEVDGETVRADLCVVGGGGPNDAPIENLFVRVPHSGTPPSKAELRMETPVGTVTVSDG